MSLLESVIVLSVTINRYKLKTLEIDCTECHTRDNALAIHFLGTAPLCTQHYLNTQHTLQCTKYMSLEQMVMVISTECQHSYKTLWHSTVPSVIDTTSQNKKTLGALISS
jgi:hypothetical protein